MSDSVVLPILRTDALQHLPRSRKISYVDIGASQRRQPLDVLLILFEYPSLLTNGACCVALLAEQLAKLEISRPVRWPLTNDPLCLSCARL